MKVRNAGSHAPVSSIQYGYWTLERPWLHSTLERGTSFHDLNGSEAMRGCFASVSARLASKAFSPPKPSHQS